MACISICLRGISFEGVDDVVDGLQQIVYRYVEKMLPDPSTLPMCIRPSSSSVGGGQIKDTRQTD